MSNDDYAAVWDESGEPIGIRALGRVMDMQDGYEALTLQMLRAGQLGVRAPGVFENLGTGLLLLTEAGSCAWGCRGGDHIIENLARRFCNYAFGAIRLACLGLYDEAVGLVRSLAELGNLLQLFYLDGSYLVAWRRADSKRKLKDFGPYKIRLAIESLGHDPVTEKDTYSRLCEMGVHVSPVSAYLSHDVGGRLYVGGNYSAPGFLLVLNETARRIAPLLSIVGSLVGAPYDKARIIEETARELAESASGLGVDNYEEFLDSNRDEHAKESALQALDQMGEAKFQPWSQSVIEDMTNRGELPADITDLTEEEFQDKVAAEMIERLSKQAIEKEMEEEDLWVRQSAAAALMHDTLAKAARYRGDQTSPDENTEPRK